MKATKHLFKLSSDETYCGITMEQIKVLGRSKCDLTVDSDRHTCDECDRGLGLYLLSKA